jgi:hypothetical protein
MATIDVDRSATTTFVTHRLTVTGKAVLSFLGVLALLGVAAGVYRLAVGALDRL